MLNLFSFGGPLRRPAQWLAALALALLALAGPATAGRRPVWAVSPPDVTTTAPTGLTATSAVLGGNVTNEYSSGPVNRGVLYSTTNATPTVGGAGVTQNANGTGPGAYAKTITGLQTGTTYYVRAYATNIYNGTGYGAVQTFTPTAPTNNALAFDGVDDEVNTATTAPAFGTTNFTIEAWVRNATTDPTQVTVALGSVGGGDDYWLGQNARRAAISVSGTACYSTTLLNDNRWHHLAGVRSGGQLTIYVDGVAENTVAIGTSGSPTSPLSIGSFGGSYFWQGRLDEVRLYNTALTAAQVLADMYSTTAAVPASLKAYYNFDQGVAGGNNAGLTTLPDVSGNGNNGTLSNFALTGTTSNWVRSFPTITGISPGSGTVGTAVTFTGTNLTDITSLTFNGTPLFSFGTPVNDLTVTYPVPNGATTGPVSIASATLARYNGPVFTVLASAVTWTGAVSTDWATAGNWSPAQVPIASVDVTIPAAPANQPVVSGVQTAKNVTVQAGARLTLATATAGAATVLTLGDVNQSNGSLTLASGSTFAQQAATEIYITANLTNNGATFALDPTSEVGFGGVSHALNGTTGVTFQTLTVGEQGNGDYLAIQVPVQVRRKLGVYNSSNATLSTGGSLTLLSDATGTALVENGVNSTVTGPVTVQRYIDPSLNAGAGYRHYSAPVSNSTVADLATAGFAPVVNSTYNSSATPLAETPFPTVFGYDQSRLATATNNLNPFDKGWLSPTATTDPLAVGRGYTVNIAGSQLVDFVGTLNNGTVTQTLSRNAGATATNAGWHLVGNPYPAPLDWSRVAPADRVNLDAAMYVFESAGQYTGSYRANVNGVGGNANSGSSLIGSSQGFFVRVSTGQTSGTLTFRNTYRVTDPATQVPFRRTAADPRPQVQLDLRSTAGLADAFYAYAETGATPGADAGFDAVKMPNSTGLNLSSAAASGEALAIDGRPAFTAATVLPLNVGVPAAGTYTLTAAAVRNLPAGLDAYLRDALTGQTVNLRTQPAYSFSVSAAQASTLLMGRFSLSFAASTALATAPALTAAQVRVFPNPAHARFAVQLPGVAGAAAVQAELLNALGQVVRRQSAALPASGTTLQVETADLAPGVYVLRLLAGPATLAQRVVVE